MATKLMDAVSLVGGSIVFSDELTDVGNLTIHGYFTGVNDSLASKIEVSLVRKDGESSDSDLDYVPVLNPHQTKINEIRKTDNFSINIAGVNSESVKVAIKSPENVTAGTVTVYYTQSANPNS